MTGDRHSSDDGTDRDSDDDRPPENEFPRHGSPSRRLPSEPLYLDAADLAALWPTVERRLYRRLLRAGVDRDTARDVCQDVASAFLRSPQRVRSREELVEKALLAGYRRWERLRRRQERVQLGEVPDRAVPDVADEVERHHIAAAVAAALDALPERDRLAFREETKDTPARTPDERNRLYVRRHRALTRLRSRLRGWLVGVYVSRQAPKRLALLADGPLRVASTAAVLAAAASLLPSPGTQQAVTVTPSVARARPPGVLDAGSRPAAPLSATDRGSRAIPPPRSQPPATTHAAADRRVDHVFELRGPLATEAGVGTGERPSGDRSLVCWEGLRIVDDRCVQHPLRNGDNSAAP